MKCDLLKVIMDGAPDKACIRDPSTIILCLPVSNIAEPNKIKISVLHIDKSVQILIIYNNCINIMYSFFFESVYFPETLRYSGIDSRSIKGKC